MNGRGFGTGFVAGLIVAILIVGVSSGIYFTFGLFGSFTSASAGELPLVSASTTTAFTTIASTTVNAVQTATTTLTATMVSSTTRSPSGNLSAITSVTSSTAFTVGQSTTSEHAVPVTTSSVPPATYGSQGNNTNSADNAVKAAGVVPSSRLYDMVHQPVFTDAVVLVPVILAFFLGAVIYRLSTKSNEKEVE